MHDVAREGEGRQRDNRAYVEFGIDLQSNIVVVPRRRDNIGTGPKGLPGLRRCSTRSSKPDNTEIETSAHGCYSCEAVLSLFAKEPRRH